MSLKNIRNHLRNLLFPLKPPTIHTPWGPTTEWARRQAALNLCVDPVKRKEVLALLTEQEGSPEAGMKEARRRYPEVHWDA